VPTDFADIHQSEALAAWMVVAGVGVVVVGAGLLAWRARRGHVGGGLLLHLLFGLAGVLVICLPVGVEPAPETLAVAMENYTHWVRELFLLWLLLGAAGLAIGLIGRRAR